MRLVFWCLLLKSKEWYLEFNVKENQDSIGVYQEFLFIVSCERKVWGDSYVQDMVNDLMLAVEIERMI